MTIWDWAVARFGIGIGIGIGFIRPGALLSTAAATGLIVFSQT